MIRGLYIAATMMNANEKVLETIGNNVANIDTTGFKKDDLGQESFSDILISKYNGSDATTEKPFTGIKVDETSPKYFEVSTTGGYFVTNVNGKNNYSKSMKFTVDKDGDLSTYYLNTDRQKDDNLGSKVIGQNGKIHVGTGSFQVNKDGSVTVNGQVVGNLVSKVAGNVIGTMGSGVKADRVITDFSQGTTIPTGNMLDIALKGPGFFEVKTPYGMMYTRSGAFTLDAQKRVVNSDGYPVQGVNGDIVIDSGKLSVNEYGEIITGDQITNKFKLVDFTNKGDLRKVGLGLYRYSDQPTGKITDAKPSVVQGSIEQSNVNAIGEMIRMISVQRDYENGQKLVRTIDETIQKAVTEVGQLR